MSQSVGPVTYDSVAERSPLLTSHGTTCATAELAPAGAPFSSGARLRTNVADLQAGRANVARPGERTAAGHDEELAMVALAPPASVPEAGDAVP
jgi:hypothetical protein